MSVRTLRYNTATQHFTKSALASTDRDALAFLEAAQIYNTNQQRAIVNLVRSLKRVGLWSKMKAIYPFIGGTATSHKWNLKDPRDVDAAFRLSFSGGWTHSSTGALPNGTNAWADTFLTPSVSLSQNSTHISYYSRTNSNGVEVEIGAENSSGNNRIFIEARTTDTTYTTINTNPTGDFFSYSDTDSRAYYIASRNSSTEHVSYRNDVKKGTKTRNSSGLTNTSIYIGRYNRASSPPPASQYYSFKEAAFATIGDGLTDSEASALYNIVDLYQKRLGRAV